MTVGRNGPLLTAAGETRCPSVLLGVPMSVDHSLTAQRVRLAALGLAVADVATLTAVDTIEDAALVAAHAPGAFARASPE